MASQWTNKYAILRDLSFAQGRKVPTDFVGSVGYDEKPPATTVEEETEEEYIENSGDGEVPTKPDLFMIKHMLDWVNKVDVVDDDDTEIDKVVVISKLNATSSVFVPKSSIVNDANTIKNEGAGDNYGIVASKQIGTNNSGVSLPKSIGSGDHNAAKDTDAEIDKVVMISKLNPTSSVFVPKSSIVNYGIVASKQIRTNNSGVSLPKSIGSGDHNAARDTDAKTSAEPNSNNVNCQVNPKKKRKQRNVALLALLQKEHLTLADNLPNADYKTESTVTITESEKQNAVLTIKDEPKELKLLKPHDFMNSMINTDLTAHEKVTNWLQTPVEHHTPKIKPTIAPPSNMFKKKVKTPILDSGAVPAMFKRKSGTGSSKSSDSDPIRDQSNSTFVPSAHANEYYQKYLERNQAQKTLQEDIWQRAERIMKEIEAERLKNKEEKLVENLDEAITSVDLTDVHSQDIGTKPVDDIGDQSDSGERVSYCKPETEETRRNQSTPSPGAAFKSKTEGTISNQLSPSPGAACKPKTEETISNLSSPSPGAAPQGIEIVRLPQHRHELPEDCKVCLVLEKYKPKLSDSLMTHDLV